MLVVGSRGHCGFAGLLLAQTVRTLRSRMPMRSQRCGARAHLTARTRNRSPVPYPLSRSALTGPRRPEQPGAIGRSTAYDAHPRASPTTT
jgi:hypothetical protein